MKLNKDKDFGTIHPPLNGAYFTQGVHFFDNHGNQIDVETGKLVPEIEVEVALSPDAGLASIAAAEEKARAEAEALQKASDDEKAALAQTEDLAGVAHVVAGDSDGDGVADAPFVVDSKPKGKGRR